MMHYVCKYTPVELFKGFGEECAVLEEMPENFEMSDRSPMPICVDLENQSFRPCWKEKPTNWSW